MRGIKLLDLVLGLFGFEGIELVGGGGLVNWEGGLVDRGGGFEDDRGGGGLEDEGGGV